MKRNKRPTEIHDAAEFRVIPINRMELRAADDAATEVELTGYASTFEPYEMYGGPANYGWIEQLDRHAFDKTLREKPDVMLLINHEGMPLARTKSGTLELSVDDHGLKVRAMLDRSDPDVQRLESKMRRGDMDEMSFAFRVKSQTWSATDEFPDDSQAHRMINEVSLHKGDVSVVNYGANPTTHAEVKGLDAAVKMLADATPQELELVDVRSDSALLSRAKVNLETMTTKPEKPNTDERSDDAAPAEAKPKGRTRMEALRSLGLSPKDGTTLKSDDVAAIEERDNEAFAAVQATGAAHAALLAKLNGKTDAA